MSSKVTYQKLSLHDQILLRPDTYIGSIQTLNSTQPMWISSGSEEKVSFEYRTVKLNDGLLRLVIEVISNAIDNVWRSVESKQTPRFIKITVSPQEVSVWNDGANISTELHETEKIPVPEMIFGNLLTSSNYNDNEERKTSGRNGLGSKACNIFSKSFSVKIFNATERIVYTQEWKDNMKTRQKPVLAKKGFPSTIEEGKNGYTLVTFSPDFSRFGETEFNAEHLAMIRKLVIDAAMTVHFHKVKVFLNGTLIKMDDLSDYVKYYFPKSQEDESDIEEPLSDSEPVEEESGSEQGAERKKVHEELFFSTPESKVLVRPSNGDFMQVSFVNGIQTFYGGVHVENWCEALFRPLVSKINGKKDKSLHIDIRDIKKHFFVFVFSTLDKPTFDSQSKTRLTGPDVKTDVKSTHISKMMKWSFIDKIEESLKLKELAGLKKSTERKKGTTRVEKLDDANFAGGKKSQECSLFISEGDSAKTYVVQGMKEGLKQFGGKGGRDVIGVLPIRGKFLNVKNASAQMLMNNKEVKSLIQALGLQFDVDYTKEENRKKLRYGRLICSCDADHDGSHIVSLLYNFFQTLFPSLIANNDFFYFMRVPIIKIDQGPKKAPLSFFYQEEANAYINQHKVPKSKIKYYKGLGTANSKDVKEDFARRLVSLSLDDKTNALMDHIFHKDHTGFRKDWLRKYTPLESYPVVKDYDLETLAVPQFLNQELIQFSIDDCRRSIPHLLDGFKESHRKVMYAAFKRNLRYNGPSLKVAQFAGYTSEHSGYHHGENNLLDTITKLAQRFAGSNNIPLLFNDGAFGTRSEGGKDAANGRYIFTKMDRHTRLLFREEDEPYLPDRLDDGETVEKEYYLPILPMVLVNPTLAGIGTGWSCNVPGFNPKDLIEWIRDWLAGDALTGESFKEGVQETSLTPWYRGFEGSISVDVPKVITTGVFEQIKNNTYRITEIPIGKRMLSISKYKEFLEDLREKGTLKTILDHSTEEKVDFTVTSTTELNHLKLGLIDSISMGNMVLFDSNNKIKKYANVTEILEEYCTKRLELYSTRKDGQLKQMRHEERVLDNKIRFIQAILNETIVLKGKDEETLEKELDRLQFMRVDGKYDYLLSIQVRSMTSKRLADLQHELEQLRKAIKTLEKITPSDLWLQELKALEKEL